jgi:hypothetical protein
MASAGAMPPRRATSSWASSARPAVPRSSSRARRSRR